MRATNLNAEDSAWLVIRECSVFWEKARIPTQVSQRDDVHIIVAVLDAVGRKASDDVLNRFSINQQREEKRKILIAEIVQKFTSTITRWSSIGTLNY